MKLGPARLLVVSFLTLGFAACQSPQLGSRGETELEGNQYDFRSWPMPNKWDIPPQDGGESEYEDLKIHFRFSHPKSASAEERLRIQDQVHAVFVRALTEQCARFNVIDDRSNIVSDQLEQGVEQPQLDLGPGLHLGIEVDVLDQTTGNKIVTVQKIQRSIGLTLQRNGKIVASKNYIGAPVYRILEITGGTANGVPLSYDQSSATEEVMSAQFNAYRAAQFLNQNLPVNAPVKSLDLKENSAAIKTSSRLSEGISAQQAFVLWAWDLRREAPYPLAFCGNVEKGGGRAGSTRISLDRINRTGRSGEIWSTLQSRQDGTGFVGSAELEPVGLQLYATSFGTFIAESVEARKYLEIVRAKSDEMQRKLEKLGISVKIDQAAFEY